MVIDFFVTSRPSLMEWSLISLFTSRPSPMEWSLISFFTSRPFPMEWSLIFLCLHQGPLRCNGHWFSYIYIKVLSDGMVIDFLMFTSRSSPMEWSFISFFTSRPSPMEWSLISLSQWNPLLRNGRVCFLLWITTLFFELFIVYDWFVFFPLFLWNLNEISIFIFTHLLPW